MAQQARRLGRSTLPAELTSFVGRRQELREVKRLLGTTRLLTLTGSGGAGKTRLALRAAAEMARGFPDGAWLVPVAPVQDPMLVPQAVFGALGVHDLSAGASLTSLTDYLAGASARYWLLDTLRQYGQERLRELGEQVTMQARHLEWVRALAKLAGAWDARQAEMFARMSGEQDNLWAALDFCQRNPAEAAAAAELARNLVAYWSCRGPFGDVRRILAALIAVTPQESLPRARLLWVAATIAAAQSDFGACAALSEQSLRIATEVQDVEAVGWSLICQASVLWAQGDAAAAAERLESALSLARLMRARRLELTARDTLCGCLVAQGDLERAIEVGEQVEPDTCIGTEPTLMEWQICA